MEKNRKKNKKELIKKILIVIFFSREKWIRYLCLLEIQINKNEKKNLWAKQEIKQSTKKFVELVKALIVIFHAIIATIIMMVLRKRNYI